MPPILWTFSILITCVLCWADKRIVTLHLPKFKQPDDVDTHYYLAPINSTGSCTRECKKGDHRICYYKFHVENYAVLTAACGNCTENEEDCYLPQCVTTDGFERGVLTVNRRIPGPSIQVCYGDRIIVDVENVMLSRTLSIHWHGIVQKNRNHMDGVPYINQCPIPEDTKFRYDYRADSAGTMYWHSHAALHKLNGLQGSLIVRVPKEYEPHHKQYDYDLPAHHIFIMDWYHQDAEFRLPGLRGPEATQFTTYYIVNGRGQYQFDNGTRTTTPFHVFKVKQGMRYRFRVTGAVCTQCPSLLRIEGHKLLVIATDGSPINPVLVDDLQIFSGERYDFVLNANNEVGTYWIQIRSMAFCFRRDVCQFAILKYEGSPDKYPRTPRPTLRTFRLDGTMLNPTNASCSDTRICLTQLYSIRRVNDRILKERPDLTLEFTFGFHLPSRQELFYSGNYPRYLQINPSISAIPIMSTIQQTLPPSPLQSQYDDIPDYIFCPNGTDGLPTCPEESRNFCTCVPIVRIPLGAMVQFVVIDRSPIGTLNHPFHLHGHTYNLIASGTLPSNLMNAQDISQLIENKEIPISPSPVFKDTVPVPARGFIVIRFIANNPGFWFFHCHFLYHHVSGMGTILQIGDQSEFPSIPRGFPRCGNFLPPVRMMVVTKGRQNSYPQDFQNDKYRLDNDKLIPTWSSSPQYYEKKGGIAAQDVEEEDEEEVPIRTLMKSSAPAHN